MKLTSVKIPLVVLLLTSSHFFPTPWIVNVAGAQSEEAQAINDGHDHDDSDHDQQDDEKTKNATKADDGAITDTATVIQTPISDKSVRFHMWDGTVISGEIQVDAINVKTRFGTLEIPVRDIRQFHPGLDSFPELNQQILEMVERLGDKDFDVREKSHRALAAMGIQLRNEIDNFNDGGSAERKKRLAEIRKEIDELVDEMDDEDMTAGQGLIRGDTIQTQDFSIVGKILQDEFALTTKFGKLNLRLGDIKMADRTYQDSRSDIQKSVAIASTTFFQRKPLSTRIRVNKGDVIKIRASGTIQWTNWNTSSTPDGLPSQGQYMGIQSGTLTARIGPSGKLQKIGTKGEFVASKNGVLFLAIAVQDNYANNNSYRWTGEYKAKIKVQPKSK